MSNLENYSYRVEMDLRAIADETARQIGKTHDALVLDALEREYGFVRVIHCKDCKHYSEHKWVMVTDVCDVCTFFAGGVKVKPDGFCAWSERKETEE